MPNNNLQHAKDYCLYFKDNRSKNNLNLRTNTEHSTAGADAMVYIQYVLVLLFLKYIWHRNQTYHLYLIKQLRLGFYVDTQIIVFFLFTPQV